MILPGICWNKRNVLGPVATANVGQDQSPCLQTQLSLCRAGSKLILSRSAMPVARRLLCVGMFSTCSLEKGLCVCFNNQLKGEKEEEKTLCREWWWVLQAGLESWVQSLLQTQFVILADRYWPLWLVLRISPFSSSVLTQPWPVQSQSGHSTETQLQHTFTDRWCDFEPLQVNKECRSHKS